jgi:hypothetical protein
MCPRPALPAPVVAVILEDAMKLCKCGKGIRTRSDGQSLDACVACRAKDGQACEQCGRTHHLKYRLCRACKDAAAGGPVAPRPAPVAVMAPVVHDPELRTLPPDVLARLVLRGREAMAELLRRKAEADALNAALSEVAA